MSRTTRKHLTHCQTHAQYKQHIAREKTNTAQGKHIVLTYIPPPNLRWVGLDINRYTVLSLIIQQVTLDPTLWTPPVWKHYYLYIATIAWSLSTQQCLCSISLTSVPGTSHLMNKAGCIVIFDQSEQGGRNCLHAVTGVSIRQPKTQQGNDLTFCKDAECIEVVNSYCQRTAN